jgi:class 3 adenylate cyclase
MVEGGTTTVTVLVTDLVDSTRLLQLGAGGFDDVRRSSLDAMGAGIAAARGTVVKSTGDGVLAVFTSAADAVAAAVAVQRSADALRRRDARCPAVRVGVATGEATPEDGDWYGAPVIEAARLCGLAEGGQIVTTAVVRALVGPHRGHRWRPLEPVVLKGFDEAVDLVEVGWEPAPSDAPPLPAAADQARTASIVGRSEELDRLVTAWKGARAGEVRTVLVSGEPGVGKTRLVAELAAAAREDGATVLWGRCDEDLGAGYRPFTEALRLWFATGDRSTDGLDRTALGRILPELGPETSTGVVAGGDAEGERLRLFDAVVGLLHRAAEDGPLLLVLDDLHWATTPTLLLLRHLVLDARPVPLLVAVTYRDTELDRAHPLSGVLADLRRASDAERVPLSGLSETGVLELLEDAAGGDVDATAEDLAAAIHAETEGNPFFVGQILRHLVETGAVVRDGSTWRLARPIADVGIPEGVREVVGWRLSRLSETTNEVLAVAAVAGRDFDLTVLRAGTERAEDELIPALDEAVAAHLVLELDDSGRFTFVHALVRQTLLAELTWARRALVHRRIGERLARRPGADPAAVAHHLCEGAVAGAVEEAVRWSLLAMDATWAQLAFEEGVAVGRRVVEVLDLVDDGAHRARAEVLSRLSRLVQYVGDTLQAKELGDAAVAAGRASGDPLAFGGAVAARYMWARAGVAEPDAVATIEEAVAAVGDQAPATRALLLGTAALHRAVNENEGAAALPQAVAAVEAARGAGDPFVLQLALFTQASVVLGTPDVGTQLAVLAQLEDLQGQTGIGGPVTAFDRARVRFVVSLQRGDRAGAARAIEEGSETAGVVGVGRMPAAMTSMWRACLALADGRLAEARTEADGLLALASLDPNFQNSWASLVFRVAWEEGTAGTFVDLVRGVAEATPGLVALRVVLAQALLAAGDDAGARAILRELVADDLAAVPRDVVWSATLAQLTELAAGLDDAEAAAALRPHVEPFAGQLVVVAWGVFVAGAAERYLGMVDLVTGDAAAALRHLDAAVEQEEALGMTGLALRSRWWRARALAAVGRIDEAGRESDGVTEAAAALGIGPLTVPAVGPQHPQGPLPPR